MSERSELIPCINFLHLVIETYVYKVYVNRQTNMHIQEYKMNNIIIIVMYTPYIGHNNMYSCRLCSYLLFTQLSQLHSSQSPPQMLLLVKTLVKWNYWSQVFRH